MATRFQKLFIALTLVCTMAICAFPASAGMLPSKLSDGTTPANGAGMETIQQTLEMKIVQLKLGELGFGQDKVYEKLNELSVAQIHEIATKIDRAIIAGASQAAEDELAREGAETLRWMRTMVMYAIIGGICLSVLMLVLVMF